MTEPNADDTWPHYYQATRGRAPRPLLAEALEYIAAQPMPYPTRRAVDLGCGDGTETVVLLQQGWRVLAIDQQPEAIALVRQRAPAALRPQLETQVAAFAELVLPPAELVYAGFSLPFCAPDAFPALWTTITTALVPGGLFAGQLFGMRDSWADDPTMTFHTLAAAQALLQPYDVVVLREEERDGAAVSGPKHWHVFLVIARKR